MYPLLEVEAVMQFLGGYRKQLNGYDVYLGEFSDGFFKDAFSFAPLLEKQFEDMSSQFDIFKLKFYMKNLKDLGSMLLINDFDPIYRNVPRMIGDPIQFEANTTAPRISPYASNIIPPEAQRVKQEEPSTTTPRPRTFTSLDLLRKRENIQIYETNYNKIVDLKSTEKSWLIKARVLHKTDLRPFRKNQGKYFSLTLRDQTDVIRATFFKNVAEQYYEKIKEKKIYTFTGGEVEKASNFNTTSNKYEIIFKDNVIVQEQKEDESIPRDEYEFKTIKELLETPVNTMVSVLAIVRDPSDVEVKDLKRGGAKELRKIRIVDFTNEEIDVNLWGDVAHKIYVVKDQIYLFKNLKLKTFNESKYLLWENFTTIVGDEIPCETYRRLKEWKTEQVQPKRVKKSTKGVINISPSRSMPATTTLPPIQLHYPDIQTKNNYASIREINKISDEFFSEEGNRNKKLFFEFTGYMSISPKAIWYESCGANNCKKKVIKIDNHMYYCDKCHLEIKDPVLRFMTDIKVTDCNSKLYGRIFGDENCFNIFDQSVEEIRDLKEKEPESFSQLMTEVPLTEFYFRALVKKNEFQQNDFKQIVEFVNVLPIEKELEAICAKLIECLQPNSDGRQPQYN